MQLMGATKFHTAIHTTQLVALNATQSASLWIHFGNTYATTLQQMRQTSNISRTLTRVACYTQTPSHFTRKHTHTLLAYTNIVHTQSTLTIAAFRPRCVQTFLFATPLSTRVCERPQSSRRLDCSGVRCVCVCGAHANNMCSMCTHTQCFCRSPGS